VHFLFIVDWVADPNVVKSKSVSSYMVIHSSRPLSSLSPWLLQASGDAADKRHEATWRSAFWWVPYTTQVGKVSYELLIAWRLDGSHVAIIATYEQYFPQYIPLKNIWKYFRPLFTSCQILVLSCGFMYHRKQWCHLLWQHFYFN